MRPIDESPLAGPLRIVLVGTGTGVGKTHVACALLSAWSHRAGVVGLKPIETGIGSGDEGLANGGGSVNDRTRSEAWLLRGGAGKARGGEDRRRGAAGGPRAAGAGARGAKAGRAGDSGGHGGRSAQGSLGSGRPGAGHLGFPGLGSPGRSASRGGEEASDQERLALAAQMFHVKRSRGQRRSPRAPGSGSIQPLRSLYAFPEPVSPHLAARDAGTRIDIGLIERWVSAHEAAVTVIETAGGLFSPLGHGLTNFELLQALRPHAAILVASDRLGVLHELTTTLALASARGGPALAVVLSAPAKRDASTGRNADELDALGIAHPVALFPRAAPSAVATAEAAHGLITWLEHGGNAGRIQPG